MGVKSGAGLLFARLKIRSRRLINRCPRWLRVLAGPLLGGFLGLMGGIPGFLIGLLLGYLLRELFVQFGKDRRILGYFENPGAQQFHEGESGLAAWCALGVLVASEASAEVPAESSGKKSGQFPPGSSKAFAGERILKEVLLTASCVFTGAGADPFLIEHFSRLALSRKDSLNPDLLAESLAARRASLQAQARGTQAPGDRTEGTREGLREDLRNLGRGLSSLAEGEKAQLLAREIRIILDPALEDEKEPEDSGRETKTDPWKILGLPPGTPPKEVKAHYRRLAKIFHPDELEVLGEKHREMAALTFMAIKEAYREVSRM